MKRGQKRSAVSLARDSAGSTGYGGWSWLAAVVLAEAVRDLTHKDEAARREAQEFLDSEWAEVLRRLALFAERNHRGVVRHAGFGSDHIVKDEYEVQEVFKACYWNRYA